MALWVSDVICVVGSVDGVKDVVVHFGVDSGCGPIDFGAVYRDGCLHLRGEEGLGHERGPRVWFAVVVSPVGPAVTCFGLVGLCVAGWCGVYSVCGSLQCQLRNGTLETGERAGCSALCKHQHPLESVVGVALVPVTLFLLFRADGVIVVVDLVCSSDCAL